MRSLVPADEPWALWTLLLLAAAFGLWGERTPWGARISGAVLTILVTFTLSNLSIIPVQAPTYDAVWSYLVPLAIPLLLLQADLQRILREAGPTLIAFALGAIGTVAGTLLAFRLVPLGPEGPKLAGIFCATYIGGSMNYAATAEALDLHSGDLLTAGVAADNLMMTLYFLVLFALPSIRRLRASFPSRPQLGSEEGATADPSARPPDPPLDLLPIALALAVGAGLCAAGYGLAALLRTPGVGILFVTALTVTLATLFPARLAAIAGADRIGVLLMQVFFAAIGASANVSVVLQFGPKLLLFAAAILTVHLTCILVAGKFLRLDLAEIVIASNANMGGPTTAAAMAAARGWRALVLPAVLCGTLGYAGATFIGVAVGRAL